MVPGRVEAVVGDFPGYLKPEIAIEQERRIGTARIQHQQRLVQFGGAILQLAHQCTPQPAPSGIRMDQQFGHIRAMRLIGLAGAGQLYRSCDPVPVMSYEKFDLTECQTRVDLFHPVALRLVM